MAESREATIKNRAAFHNYEVLETWECGVELQGTEVKSVREGKVNLKDAYGLIRDGEVWLFNVHISPYTHGNRLNHEPLRTRKLLMHRYEIEKLSGKTVEKGLTLVPLKMYFKNGRVKVELGLARGKKNYDKRETEIRKTVDRETRQMLKERQAGRK
jgi:SsrA-binding protein